MVMTYWRSAGIRPIFDASANKGTENIIACRGQSSNFVPGTIVVGRSANGSYCVTDMLQAGDKFEVMGGRNDTKFVSPAKRHVQLIAFA